MSLTPEDLDTPLGPAIIVEIDHSIMVDWARTQAIYGSRLADAQHEMQSWWINAAMWPGAPGSGDISTQKGNAKLSTDPNHRIMIPESRVRFSGDKNRAAEVLGNITGTKIEIDAQGYINFFSITDPTRNQALIWLQFIMKSGKRIDISFAYHGTNVFNYSNKEKPVVNIDEHILLNPENRYWSTNGNLMFFNIEQVLAHEFLGHGLDWIIGNHPENGGYYSIVDLESWAIYVENVIIGYMGGAPRDCYNCWDYRDIIFRLFHTKPNWEIYKIK